MKKIAILRKIISGALVTGLIVALAAVGPVLGETFTGGISTGDGCLVGTPNSVWAAGPSSLQWVISQNIDGTWHYNYEIFVPRGDVSHAIIEASNPFDNGFPDIFNAAGNFADTVVDTFDPGTSNPNMPGSIYGIKFDSATGTNVLIDFDSDRKPVWGNFYSKDGNADNPQGVTSAIWNKSFLDPNPTDPPDNGSNNCKILRPDSPVPEPAALALVPMGLASLLRFRRKTTK